MVDVPHEQEVSACLFVLASEQSLACPYCAAKRQPLVLSTFMYVSVKDESEYRILPASLLSCSGLQ